MDDKLKEELIAEAKAGRKNAYVPYSSFAVGAAVLTDEGNIFRGCNVENAAYGATNCAERTAIFSAVAEEGSPNIEIIVVVADTPSFPSPCGPCRQVLVEFNPEMQVILVNSKGKEKITTAAKLLPHYFNCEDMR